MRYLQKVFLLSLCLLCAGQQARPAGRSAHSATLGYGLEARIRLVSTAKLSDEAYWATHHVCIARIASLCRDPEDINVDLETERRFTDGAPSRIVARGSGFCLPGDDTPRSVEIGDRLLISFLRDKKVEWIDAEVLRDRRGESALCKRLARISALCARANAVRDIVDGALDDDAVVSAYCLRRLVKRPPGLTADDQRRLNRLRESAASEAERKELLNPTTPWHRVDDLMLRTECRLLADQLLRATGALDRSASAEADWLEHKIQASRFETLGQLSAFSRRLAGITSERARVVDFAARVAIDGSQRGDVRIAMLDVFDTLALPDRGVVDDGTKKLAAASAAIMLFGTCADVQRRRTPLSRNHTQSRVFRPDRCADYQLWAQLCFGLAIATQRDEALREQIRLIYTSYGLN